MDESNPDADHGHLRVLLDHLGLPALDDEEAELVLDLARVVAHGFQRRFAPLTAYALGVAADGADREDRVVRLRALIDTVADDEGA